MESFESITLPRERLESVYHTARVELEENKEVLDSYAERAYEAEKQAYKDEQVRDDERVKDWGERGLLVCLTPQFAMAKFPRGIVRTQLSELRDEVDTMMKACRELGVGSLVDKGVITLSYAQFQRMQRFARREVVAEMLEEARKQ